MSHEDQERMVRKGATCVSCMAQSAILQYNTEHASRCIPPTMNIFEKYPDFSLGLNMADPNLKNLQMLFFMLSGIDILLTIFSGRKGLS